MLRSTSTSTISSSMNTRECPRRNAFSCGNSAKAAATYVTTYAVSDNRSPVRRRYSRRSCRGTVRSASTRAYIRWRLTATS